MLEQPLLPRIADGDSAAVTIFIDRYGNLICSLANRFCDTSEEADDAVQDIFLELWKCADRFCANKGTETSFVAMIARRRLIDMRRKKGRAMPKANIEVDNLAESESCVLECNAELNEQVQRALKVIKSLPKAHRRVIMLAVYGGMSQSEVALKTDLPLGTVKTWIRQGLRKMRRELDKANTPNSFPESRKFRYAK